jgi:hypothetical protein
MSINPLSATSVLSLEPGDPQASWTLVKRLASEAANSTFTPWTPWKAPSTTNEQATAGAKLEAVLTALGSLIAALRALVDAVGLLVGPASPSGRRARRARAIERVFEA